jgi:hypothetical protein
LEGRLWPGTIETPGLQQGELLDQVLALPLGIHPSLVDVGHLVRQALEVHLGRVSGLARIREITLPMNNGQRGGALRLRLLHSFQASLLAKVARASTSLIEASALFLTAATS